MRKLSFQIRKGTKEMILGLSLLGIMGLSAITHKTAKVTCAFIGIAATLKKKGKWDGLGAEEKEFIEAQDEAFKGLAEMSEVENKLKAFALKAVDKDGNPVDSSTLTAEQMKEFKEMVDGYKAIAIELKKIKDSGLANEKGQDPVMALLTDEKGLYQQFRAKTRQTVDIELKEWNLKVSTSDTGDIATATFGYRVPGIGQIPVRKPFLLDILPVVPVNLEYIKYVDQESITRDAKNVAGIAASTTTTAVTWKERNIQITKVRDFIYLNIDMLSDYDFVLGELQRLITSSVLLKADNGLLKDSGVYPDLHSIDEKSSEFSAANTLSGTIQPFAGTVKDPNIFDLTIAMASQIIALGKDNNWMPDTVLWNTIDKYKSMLVKDQFGQYLLPPFVVKVGNTEYAIDNMKVRSNPNVPANTCYVFDSSKSVVYMRKGFGLEMAYNNNSDFEKEMATMKGYMRLNLLIRNVDANAFMKCSDIATAITSLTATIPS